MIRLEIMFVISRVTATRIEIKQERKKKRETRDKQKTQNKMVNLNLISVNILPVNGLSTQLKINIVTVDFKKENHMLDQKHT